MHTLPADRSPSASASHGRIFGPHLAIAATLIAAITPCAATHAVDARTAPVDGLYAILQTVPLSEPAPAPTAGTRVVKYVARKAPPANSPAPASRSSQWLVLAANPDVMLQLDGRPEFVADSRGGRIRLRLADSQADRLRAFTPKNVGARVAWVVEGDVVMLSRVTEPIIGGHVEISSPDATFLHQLMNQLK